MSLRLNLSSDESSYSRFVPQLRKKMQKTYVALTHYNYCENYQNEKPM